MKKKSLFLFIVTAILTVSAFAASRSWYVVSDSCKKCQVNSIDRKCGKCEGFLMQYGNSKVEGKFLVSPFKCKECSHKCIFKIKY